MIISDWDAPVRNEPGHDEEIMSLSWIGNTSVPQRAEGGGEGEERRGEGIFRKTDGWIKINSLYFHSCL